MTTTAALLAKAFPTAAEGLDLEAGVDALKAELKRIAAEGFEASELAAHLDPFTKAGHAAEREMARLTARRNIVVARIRELA